MKKITYIIIPIICLAGLSGCKFLDMTPTDSVSDKLVWANTTYAEYNINSFYHYIDALGQFDTGQSNVGITEGMTDELKYGCTAQNTHMTISGNTHYDQGGGTGGNLRAAGDVVLYVSTDGYYMAELQGILHTLF